MLPNPIHIRLPGRRRSSRQRIALLSRSAHAGIPPVEGDLNGGGQFNYDKNEFLMTCGPHGWPHVAQSDADRIIAQLKELNQTNKRTLEKLDALVAAQHAQARQ
jgi:hypothetical protein